MRVSNRIAGGFGVLILLTVVILWYQVSIIRQMNGINKDLADLNVGQVSEALTGLDLRGDQDLFEVAAGKFVVTQDPQYLGLLQDYAKVMEKDLTKLRTAATSEKE